ncbi:MAG: YecA family protein [Hahellaceae bacterium]|nr:YecA family protein [Hahellaceae bacterium]
MTSSPITEPEIKRLEALLLDEIPESEALDYFGVHGLICANIIGPSPLDHDLLLEIILGQDPASISAEMMSEISMLIEKIQNSIATTLNQEDEVEVPSPDNEDDFESAIQNWCAGFVEAFLENEEAWFVRDEETVAELLLPVMSLSDLFDDEEFQVIKQNGKLMFQFAEQLPELITDIFLFFHSAKN